MLCLVHLDIHGKNLHSIAYTVTGAQGIATGETHAGVLAKTQEMEERIVKAGLKTGDLVFPLLYAPELLKKEFNSKVRLLTQNFLYLYAFNSLNKSMYMYFISHYFRLPI